MEGCRIIFPAPGRAELEQVPSDSRPLGPDEIAGRTLATLVSPGTELAIYQGRYAGAKFPFAPGYAAVFEVQAVGQQVKDLAPGDGAFCMGPHRSFQRASRGEAIAVPGGLAAESAVFARMIGISMTTLATTRARPPAKVLVTGLGLVGHLAARAFGLCGYEVLACDPDASRRALAEGKGIGPVLPAVPADDAKLAGKIELVVECSGHEQAVLDACRVVAPG
jgi:threonine dehydrogenase-like Zn-dependent dehydrogenase